MSEAYGVERAMSHAYRIKRYEHVTPAKRQRLLEEKLIPILDESSESQTDIKDYLHKGDWLVEYRDEDSHLYLYEVNRYQYKPHLHLYIKHYIQAATIYRLDSSSVPLDIRTSLSDAHHLELLPDSVLKMCVDYAASTNYDPDEEIKHLIFMLELNRNIIGSLGKQLLHDLDSGAITPGELKGILNRKMHSNQIVRNSKIGPSRKPADLIDPGTITGAIDKAALDAYMNRHKGQLPTKTEFEKYKKTFMSGGARRRRRRY